MISLNQFSDGEIPVGIQNPDGSNGDNVHAHRNSLYKSIFFKNSAFNQEMNLQNSALLLTAKKRKSNWSCGNVRMARIAAVAVKKMGIYRLNKERVFFREMDWIRRQNACMGERQVF